MKCLLIVAFLGAASAGVIVPAAVGLASTGTSSQFRSQDNVGNYAFGYNEDHATGGTFRRESGNSAGQVVGSYGLRDIDGRIRTVNYVADDVHGFRAAINTNEPGVEPKDPASVTINKPAAIIANGPIVAAPALAAPVFAAAPAPLLAAPAVAAPVITGVKTARFVAAAPAPAQLIAGPASVYAPAVAHYSAPLYAPAATAYTTTTQHLAAAPLVARAPLAAAYAAPLGAYGAPFGAYAAPVAAPLATYAAPVAAVRTAPLVAAAPAQYALNSYAHPAAWGYTLGLPPTFGYTIQKKK